MPRKRFMVDELVRRSERADKIRSKGHMITKEEIDRKYKEEYDLLKAQSKHLYELIVEERFTVDEVIGQSYATATETRLTEKGRTQIKTGGFDLVLTLIVTPENTKIPIRTLRFEGMSSVEGGDYISAKIPRYDTKILFDTFGSRCQQEFQVDRQFNETESAIEIKIRHAEGTVRRTDKSVDYKDFLRPDEAQE
jgi:hypothetical protein